MTSAVVAIAVGRLSLEYINQSVTAHCFFYLHSEGDLFDSLFIWRVFNGRSVGYECLLCVVGGKKAQKQYGCATSAVLKASPVCVRSHNVLLHCDFGTDDSVKVDLF